MRKCPGVWWIIAIPLVCAVGAESIAQEKGRKATVQGMLKARIELKNSKHLLIEVLADGEEAPRRYGVPYLPAEKGAVAEVHPAVLRASIGDRVRCDLVYGAYGYESGFTVVALQVVKKAVAKYVGLTDYFPPPESKGGWRTLLPEKGSPDAAQKASMRKVAGVDWDKLAQAWEHNLRAEGPSMLLVIRRGHIVGEWYNDEWMEKWGRDKAPGFYSTTKSYISTAFGLLLDDSEKGKLPGGRKLTLDTRVCNKEWMPESLPLPDPRRADITLRQLLFATSGIPREGLKIPPEVLAKAKGPFEMALGHVEGSPWARLTGEPGTMFNYSSPGVLHLILLFNNAAKMDLLPYIKQRMCDPIGMENVGWGKTGGKGFIGPYCSPGAFNCSGRDHARFLHLAMHRGKWAGQQIVPASYYDWALKGTQANPAYGAQWWLAPRYKNVPADFAQTYGHLYNDGYLIPSLDLVFVRLGRGEKFPPAFQSDLVAKVLAAVIEK